MKQKMAGFGATTVIIKLQEISQLLNDVCNHSSDEIAERHKTNDSLPFPPSLFLPSLLLFLSFFFSPFLPSFFPSLPLSFPLHSY